MGCAALTPVITGSIGLKDEKLWLVSLHKRNDKKKQTLEAKK